MKFKITRNENDLNIEFVGGGNIRLQGKKILFEDDILNKIPVGYYCLSEVEISPASIFGGTWEKLPEGYALWTATSGAGGIIHAGLPNIAGYLYVGGATMDYGNSRVGGAIQAGGYGAVNGEAGGSGGNDNRVIFNARDGECGISKIGPKSSRPGFVAPTYTAEENKVYGESNTVQPPAYKTYVWKRVA